MVPLTITTSTTPPYSYSEYVNMSFFDESYQFPTRHAERSRKKWSREKRKPKSLAASFAGKMELFAWKNSHLASIFYVLTTYRHYKVADTMKYYRKVPNTNWFAFGSMYIVLLFNRLPITVWFEMSVFFTEVSYETETSNRFKSNSMNIDSKAEKFIFGIFLKYFIVTSGIVMSNSNRGFGKRLYKHWLKSEPNMKL